MDANQPPPYQPLDDLPWHDPQQGDAARLRTIRKQLSGLICARLSDKPKKVRTVPLCVGLFGGLGQGKTSAWQQALSQADKDHKRTIRACVFEATAYPAQMLEHDFDRFIGRWNQSYLSITILSCILLFLIFLQHTSYWFAVGLLPCIPLFKIVWNDWKNSSLPLLEKEITRANNLQISWTEIIQKWWSKPDILIIDDLDRLPLTKQRILLRALHTFRCYLPPITLVVFDEHPLLNHPGDPEAPAELLHKVLDVKLR